MKETIKVLKEDLKYRQERIESMNLRIASWNEAIVGENQLKERHIATVQELEEAIQILENQ